MPTVRLSFTAAAAHVRTARLVGVAVARKSGVPSDLFDEIRLAVGEACSRAVALHRRHGLTDLVEMIIDDAAGFTIVVVDRAPQDSSSQSALPTRVDPEAFLADAPMLSDVDESVPRSVAEASVVEEEVVAANMRLALLAGLVDEISVRRVADGRGTEVRMTWPAQSGWNGAGRP